MTQRQRGYADNYAGVRRTPRMSLEWLAGWDEAQNDRLQDQREIRRVVVEYQNQNCSTGEQSDELISNDKTRDLCLKSFPSKAFSC